MGASASASRSQAGTRLIGSVYIQCYLRRRHPEVVLADDVVAVEPASRDVAGDRNRDSLTDRGASRRGVDQPTQDPSDGGDSRTRGTSRRCPCRCPVKMSPPLGRVQAALAWREGGAPGMVWHGARRVSRNGGICPATGDSERATPGAIARLSVSFAKTSSDCPTRSGASETRSQDAEPGWR